MTASLYGLAGALLVGIGLYGLIAQPHPLRKLLGFNLLGSGVFLLFGAAAARDVVLDPVPQAMVITGIVVALAATALGVALVLRLFHETGGTSLRPAPPRPAGDEE
jgi:multicomponent Na+:H+ antiporter subunit C